MLKKKLFNRKKTDDIVYFETLFKRKQNELSIALHKGLNSINEELSKNGLNRGGTFLSTTYNLILKQIELFVSNSFLELEKYQIETDNIGSANLNKIQTMFLDITRGCIEDAWRIRSKIITSKELSDLLSCSKDNIIANINLEITNKFILVKIQVKKRIAKEKRRNRIAIISLIISILALMSSNLERIGTFLNLWN